MFGQICGDSRVRRPSLSPLAATLLSACLLFAFGGWQRPFGNDVQIEERRVEEQIKHRARASRSSSELRRLPGRRDYETHEVRTPTRGFWSVELDAAPGPAFDLSKPFQLPLRSDVTVHFGQIPSPFVLLVAKGYRDHDRGCAVYDLRSKKPTSTIKSEEFGKSGDLFALRPDGRLVVDVGEIDGVRTLRFWDATTGKIARQFLQKKNIRLKQIAFISETRLVALFDNFGSGLDIWDFAANDAVAGYRSPSDAEVLDGSLAISPGGKLAAFMQQGDTLRIVDLATADLAGEFKIPTESTKAQFLGLAFAPRGARMAAVWKSSYVRRIVVWDLAKGEIISDSIRSIPRTEEDVFRRFGKSLDNARLVQWLSDDKRLLLGGTEVVDALTGEAAGAINAPSSREFLALESGEVLTTQAPQFGHGEEGRLVLAKVSAAPNAISVGASAKSSKPQLPELIVGDLSKMENKVASSGVTPWDASIKPTPTKELSTAKDVRIGRVGSIVSSLLCTSGESPRLVYSDYKDETTNLRTASLTSGKSTPALSVPAVVQLLGVSPNGTMAVTRHYELGVDSRSQRFLGPPSVWQHQIHTIGNWHDLVARRLDVWMLAQQKHAVGWVPYQDAVFEGEDLVTYASFHGTRNIITTNKAGTLVRWQFPKCAAEYALKYFGQVMGVANNGEILFGWHADTDVIRVVKAADGSCVGELNIGRQFSRILATTIPPSQSEFIAAIETDQAEIAIWDLANGKLKSSTTVNPEWLRTKSGGFAVARLDANHVLLGEHFVVDLTSGKIVWDYELPSGGALLNPPDERFWYALAIGGEGALQIRAKQLPTATDLEKISASFPSDPYLFRTGDAVRLVVESSVPETGVDAYAAISQSLRDSGTPVSEDAAYEFAYRASENSTGKNVEYESTGVSFRDKERFTVAKRVIEVQMTLSKGGVKLWSATSTLEEHEPNFIQGEPQAQFDKALRSRYADMLHRRPFPAFIFAPTESLNFGRSTVF